MFGVSLPGKTCTKIKHGSSTPSCAPFSDCFYDTCKGLLFILLFFGSQQVTQGYYYFKNPLLLLCYIHFCLIILFYFILGYLIDYILFSHF